MRKLMAVAALAVALPATASAQEAPRGPGGRGPMLNSVEWLLKSKEEFKATAEQVSKIEEISKKFDSETSKLREEMQKVRGEMMGGADRGTVMQKMRPIRDELQKKDDAAIEEVLKLLSADQQATVKLLLYTRRQEMRNRQRSGGKRQIKQ